MKPNAITKFIDSLRTAFEAGDDQAVHKDIESRNVTELQGHYQAIARGDFAAVLALFADDIEFEIIGPPAIPFVGRWRGKEQVAQAIKNNFALVENQQPEVQELVAQGDTVIVVARERGLYRPTGRPYDVHWVQVYTFRDGKLVRFREYFDSSAMIDAVCAPASSATVGSAL